MDIEAKVREYLAKIGITLGADGKVSLGNGPAEPPAAQVELSVRLAAAEAQVSTLAGEKAALEGKLAGLEAEKAALEGKLEKWTALCAPASGEGDSARPAGRLFAAAQQLALAQATRAHGAGSTGLQSEKASIEAASTVEGLLDIAEKCAAIVPAAFARATRQTGGDDTTGDGKPKTESAYAAQLAQDNPRFAKLQAKKAKEGN